MDKSKLPSRFSFIIFPIIFFLSFVAIKLLFSSLDFTEILTDIALILVIYYIIVAIYWFFFRKK